MPPVRTGHNEFVYYTQRAYELLFKLAFAGAEASSKNYLIVKTPVTVPVQNFMSTGRLLNLFCGGAIGSEKKFLS